MSREKNKSFLVSDVEEVKAEEVGRAKGMFKEWLVGEKTESSCYMRRFVMKKDAGMPLHKHKNLTHIQYILEGKIKIILGDEEFKVKKGNFLFIPEDIPHSYENLSDGESHFICIIPGIEDRDTKIL